MGISQHPICPRKSKLGTSRGNDVFYQIVPKFKGRRKKKRERKKKKKKKKKKGITNSKQTSSTEKLYFGRISKSATLFPSYTTVTLASRKKKR
jgi:hypothetical protein